MTYKNTLQEEFIAIATIDSPSGEEKAVSQYLHDRLKEIGCDVKFDSYGNVIGYKDGKGEPFILSGHMDTVEPGRGIKPVVADGKITSDGTTIVGGDNKANLASIIIAVEKCIAEKIPTRPIEIVFTREEETGLYGATNFDYSLIKGTIGVCFDKGDHVGSIVTASPGEYTIKGKYIGKAAHSGSEPEQGKNAIAMFADFASKVEQGRLTESTTANIGLLQGGTACNTVPEFCEFTAEIRSHAVEELERTKEMWINLAQESAKKFDGKFEYTAEQAYQSYSHPEDSEIIQLLKKSMSAVGIEPKLMVSGGASDANIFNLHGVKLVDLGYGVFESHTVDEWIDIAELEKVVELIMELVKQK